MITISIYYNGINIGSISINLVSISAKGNITIIKQSHYGKPREVLEKILAERFNVGEHFYGISGSTGDISEIAAIERGISSYNEKFDVVISIGGEAIVLYVLNDEGQIVNVLSHDKCAAGSGEFFIQQINRLGVSLTDAISLAQKGKKIDISSRCSVHCKSDITHKLNRGEASIADLLTSVLASMVNKVLGLIIQSRIAVKRVLLIGGVSLNAAFVKLMREGLEDIEIIIKDTSSVFEAYGTALLVKESPTHREVKLNFSKTFSMLPSLKKFNKQVTIIESTNFKKEFNKKSIFILGVDVGSTTTKAVLVNSADLTIIASHYMRTNGNPIDASRKCIKEIITQVGNCHVEIIGVTGSGRQLVGAYLGSSAIYNEISAHSQGAIFYDPNVDTIFEIGGQDSKYMYLQNGVPIDYAMNDTCSAGTGSFLEESAKGDLGIDVFNISDIAINAENPIRFKIDCAAFINTDIRTAMQEDIGNENIVAGLVYSIVENYLSKVKGSRHIGKKIFFQGGVAKNHAVGFAFAYATGKQIIIPPNPELIGAFGIALIAKTKLEKNEINRIPKQTTLKTLVKEELKHLGNFHCKICNNYCQIEKYEVGGRKFSFGGHCTRYERLWKSSSALEEKDDLVAIRNNLIFGSDDKIEEKIIDKKKIGIPRALLTHSLYPLFSTFFKELDYQVVLSDIDEDKALLTNAPFCHPVQILHGAVFDLIMKDIQLIFLPHMLNMPKGENWFESTFCPITQATPYFISIHFRETKFLKPILDFLKGYEADDSLIDMAVKELKVTRKLAKKAYLKAVKIQKEIEEKFIQIGRDAIKQINGNGEMGIVLVGRSYNAFPNETSLFIPKKLASMGISVIPFDFLEKGENSNIPWYFANYVKTAIRMVNENRNLFLLYINSFSCTIDAFIQNYVRTEMNNKPYLLLELDAHTAAAGIQTRLEAFIEIIQNYQGSKIESKGSKFQVAKIKRRDGNTVVFTSENEKLDIKDPRVKLYLPPFSKYLYDLGAVVFEFLGYHPGKPTDIILDYPIKGLRNCSGKECIPLPVVLGHIQSLVENRKPGEVIGYFMIRGGHPCAVFSYFHYIEQFIAHNKLDNVFMFRIDFETHFLGMSLLDIFRYIAPAVFIADLMHEIESSLYVVGKENSLNLFQKCWLEFLENMKKDRKYRKNINKLILNLSKIPRVKSPKGLPKVLISGDFFVRFSSFFIKELREIYAKNGIIVKSTDFLELILYSQHFMGGYIITKEWKKDPDKFSTLIRAIFTPWNKGSRLLLLSRIALKLVHMLEIRYRKRFEKTGLLYASPNNLKEIFKQAKPYISPLIFGEAIPTIGKGLEVLRYANYDTLILTGPFNCLPYKISQAILKPIYLKNNMPFLVFDADISAITPNMKRLIQANIEQIKRRQLKKGN